VEGVQIELIVSNLPSKVFDQSPDGTIRGLMANGREENCQQRSNEEWLKLVQEENDPLEPAKLLLDWINDKAQAITKCEWDEQCLFSRSARRRRRAADTFRLDVAERNQRCVSAVQKISLERNERRIVPLLLKSRTIAVKKVRLHHSPYA
jgi:hypothetical protein